MKEVQMLVGYEVSKREERAEKKKDGTEGRNRSKKFVVRLDFDWATGWRKEQVMDSCLSVALRRRSGKPSIRSKEHAYD